MDHAVTKQSLVRVSQSVGSQGNFAYVPDFFFGRRKKKEIKKQTKNRGHTQNCLVNRGPTAWGALFLCAGAQGGGPGPPPGEHFFYALSARRVVYRGLPSLVPMAASHRLRQAGLTTMILQLHLLKRGSDTAESGPKRPKMSMQVGTMGAKIHDAGNMG